MEGWRLLLSQSPKFALHLQLVPGAELPLVEMQYFREPRKMGLWGGLEEVTVTTGVTGIL